MERGGEGEKRERTGGQMQRRRVETQTVDFRQEVLTFERFAYAVRREVLKFKISSSLFMCVLSICRKKYTSHVVF